MKNWEEEYNSYINGKANERYIELEEKQNQRKQTIEEIAEFKKMNKVKANLEKVKNLLEYRDKLDANLETLKSEYEVRTVGEKLENEEQENLKKHNELVVKKREINRKMQDASLSDKDKQELSKQSENVITELAKLEEKQKKGNEKYLSNLAKSKSVNRNGLEKYSNEELREQCFKLGSMISKCNMICSKLMEGQNLEQSIEPNLKNWKDRKYNSKTPLPLTKKEKEEKIKAKKSKNTEANKEKEPTVILGAEDMNNTKIKTEEPEKNEEEDKEKTKLPKKESKYKTFMRRFSWYRKWEEIKKTIFTEVSEKEIESEETAKNVLTKQEIEKQEQKIAELNKLNMGKQNVKTLGPEEKKEEEKGFKDLLKVDIIDVANKGTYIAGRMAENKEKREEKERKEQEEKRAKLDKENMGKRNVKVFGAEEGNKKQDNDMEKE